MSRGVAPPSYGIASPCMSCTDRQVYCHDHCERYAGYREEITRIRDAEFADKMSRRQRPTATKKRPGQRKWNR